MSKLRKFFSKKKEETAFKLKLGGSLGQGYTLASRNEASSSNPRASADVYIPPKRKELSNEASAAAAAALARVEKKNVKELNTSLAYIKAQAKRELEAEHKIDDKISSFDAHTTNSSICEGVFFRCPVISDEILPRSEWKSRIKNFLHQQVEEEKALSSCLIIRNCNNKEKAEECINTLTKYLENILNYPDQEKFYKIRMLNRAFCEKVRYVDGALSFLCAAGFREVEIDNEKYLMWSKENVEKLYDLNTLIDSLQNAQSIELVLDRNIKVLLPSQAKCVDLPQDFYRVSAEEIKKELQLRAEASESKQILKTKAMREREEQRIVKMYNYTLVRVKFPNGLFIQGTFGIYETLSDVFEFIKSCLEDEELEFELVVPNEGKFTKEDMDRTLCDLRFVPNIVLLFAVHGEDLNTNYIKEDLLLLVQSI